MMRTNKSVLLLAMCLCSCNPFAPELEETSTLDNVITDQQSPKEVLQNFKYAYTFKDSLLYSELLAKSFVFEFFDPNQEPVGGFKTWGRDVDLRATGRMFREFEVIELVWLDTLSSNTQTIPQNTGEPRVIELRRMRFNLNLLGSDFNYILNGTAAFSFEQDAEDAKWRIIRWRDDSDL
jgi:hypothetical protein